MQFLQNLYNKHFSNPSPLHIVQTSIISYLVQRNSLLEGMHVCILDFLNTSSLRLLKWSSKDTQDFITAQYPYSDLL